LLFLFDDRFKYIHLSFSKARLILDFTVPGF
jgi:hypothetical protein